MVLIIFPSAFLFLLHAPNSNSAQLARVQYVLENTESSDPLYDGNVLFNLYRPDLHYFWYSVGKGKNLYWYQVLGQQERFRLFADPEHARYDIVKMIHTRKPKFISAYGLWEKIYAVKYLYQVTPHRGVYALRE